MSDRVFGGFGFRPTQGGVFAAAARQSGTFGRIIIADPDRELVDAVRCNDGSYTVNVARLDGLETVEVEGVEMYDPGQPAEREMLVHALSRAGELATCLRSVEDYDRGDNDSAAAILGRAFGMQPTLRRAIPRYGNREYEPDRGGRTGDPGTAPGARGARPGPRIPC